MTTLNSTLQLALLKQKKRKNVLQKGFTLVELMIVIVIVGILSAVALPNFLNQTNKARATEARTQMSAALKNAQMVILEEGSVGTGD
ncbi:MAG: prepilin-type N-terminal cleavage/methylation domain-containing protein, partial [Synechococcus sp. BS301-5m-G54]|nr:prepilin-type N-terminal cleavage/methylation domain-containing protein [Synechococcus sp. BS301-5m-G54]